MVEMLNTVFSPLLEQRNSIALGIRERAVKEITVSLTKKLNLLQIKMSANF